MDKIEIRNLVRQVIKEVYSNVEEAGGSHGDAKEMEKAIKWIKKNFPDVEFKKAKDGQKLCPPKDKSEECYTIHKGGKGRFDLYRFLSRAYGITKKEIEDAISSNRKINLLALDFPTIKLNKKIWYIDKDNEELILTRNANRKKSFYDLEEEDLDKVIEKL